MSEKMNAIPSMHEVISKNMEENTRLGNFIESSSLQPSVL